MVPSHRTRQDRVLARVRHALCAAGFDEAMTLSVVDENWSEAFSPWTTAPALSASMPVLRRADRLRRSLVPSLLGAGGRTRHWPMRKSSCSKPRRSICPRRAACRKKILMLALTSGRDFLAVKGVIEGLVRGAESPVRRISVRPTRHELLDEARSASCGSPSPGRRATAGLFGRGERGGAQAVRTARRGSTVAELRLAVLIAAADLVPQQSPLSVFPAVARDLNLEMADSVAWADIEKTVRQAAGDHSGNAGILRRLSRSQAGRGRPQAVVVPLYPAVARRHDDQPAGRRNPRSDRRRLPASVTAPSCSPDAAPTGGRLAAQWLAARIVRPSIDRRLVAAQSFRRLARGQSMASSSLPSAHSTAKKASPPAIVARASRTATAPVPAGAQRRDQHHRRGQCRGGDGRFERAARPRPRQSSSARGRAQSSPPAAAVARATKWPWPGPVPIRPAARPTPGRARVLIASAGRAA